MRGALLEQVLGLLEALRLALAGLGQGALLLGDVLHPAATADPPRLLGGGRLLALDVAIDRVALAHRSSPFAGFTS